MDTMWMAALLLISVRVATAVFFTSALGPSFVPASLKVLLSLGLAGCLLGCLAPQSIADIAALPFSLFCVAALQEALIGAALSAGFMIVTTAAQLAGKILDVQIGFGVAGVLNPATNAISPLIGVFFSMVLVSVFLAFNGHHQLLRALAFTVEQLRPGSFGRMNGFEIARQGSAMFLYGLLIAAPVMFTLLLVDIVLAVFARSLPQLNVLVLSFSLKTVLGMAVLSLTLRWSLTIFQNLFSGTFEFWSRIGEGL